MPSRDPTPDPQSPQIMDENKSPFYADNLAGRDADDLNGIDSEDDLEESLLKHSVNGYLFCSGPMAEMQQGDRWVEVVAEMPKS